MSASLETADYINWNECDIGLPTSFVLEDSPANRSTVPDSVERPTIYGIEQEDPWGQSLGLSNTELPSQSDGEELNGSLSSFWTHSESRAVVNTNETNDALST